MNLENIQNSLRDRNDTPGYNSLIEFKMAERKQKI